MNDPVEITCGHVYCSDCIDTFINDASSKLICPMCRKNIKRQRQKPNQNIKQLIKFVTIVTEKLKSQFGCDSKYYIILNIQKNPFNGYAKISTFICRINSSTNWLSIVLTCLSLFLLVMLYLFVSAITKYFLTVLIADLKCF